MNWEPWFCPNQACADWDWMVLSDPTNCELWWVAAHADESPFTIAATDPICPHCGATLLALIELESSFDRQLGVEVGPVFDFVRSLA